MISDWFVVRFLYNGRFAWFTPWTWGSFLLVGLIGWALRDRLTAGRIAAASLGGSVAFFLASNFGVWMSSAMYPRTATGLAACYVASLPFFRNAVVGAISLAH